MRTHAAGFLSTIFNAALRAELITKNPYPKAYKSNRRQIPNVSTEQLLALFSAVSESARVATVLAAMAGLRRGEIMGLKVGDLDFQKRQVRVVGARTRLYGKCETDKMKSTKTCKIRTLPLPSIAIPYLSPLLQGRDPSELLYPTFRVDLPKRLAVACQKVGIPPLNLHALRHVCISLLMENAGPAAAQAIASHANISTTADVYGHLSPIYLAKQMERSFLDSEFAALKEVATALQTYDDTQVRLLAEKAASVCAKWCQG